MTFSFLGASLEELEVDPPMLGVTRPKSHFQGIYTIFMRNQLCDAHIRRLPWLRIMEATGKWQRENNLEFVGSIRGINVPFLARTAPPAAVGSRVHKP